MTPRPDDRRRPAEPMLPYGDGSTQARDGASRGKSAFRRRLLPSMVLGPIDRKSLDRPQQEVALMRLHMNAADVRGLVSRHFLHLGAEADDVADVQENIRIDRGRCVARC